jgi:glycosyltransferase involved in cell wall biosynthesis
VLSVVLPFRDASAWLARAARGVLAEPEVHELVLVDDGSLDGGAGIAAGLASRDARVRLVQGPARGLVAALGAGIEASRGDLVGRMDADDESLPGRFARQLEMLADDPRLGLSATRAEVVSNAPMPGLEAYVAWQNGLVTPQEHEHALYIESPVCHPSVVIRREVLERIGGYREAGWPEDWDAWHRVHAAGYRMAKVPEVLLRWHHREGRATFGDARCAPEALVRLRASFLAEKIRASGRPFVIWGAGDTGKSLARELSRCGAHLSAWVDLDPRKVGNIVQNARILSPEARPEGAFVVIALAGRGDRALSREERDLARAAASEGSEARAPAPYARDMVGRRLLDQGLVEGRDFVRAG